MNLDLTGKTAMVCGSTQGIGRSVAMELAALGASIILVARHEARLAEVMTQLPGSGRHAYVVADFSQPEILKTRIQAVSKEFSPVHILINNTGGPPPGPASEAAPEEFENAFRQHLICNQILTMAVVPGMKGAGYGRIVNIISTSVKQPIPGLGVSNAIRGAVASWSKTLSMELAPHGITVNNVLPGATQTQRLTSLLEKKAAALGREFSEVEKEMKQEIPARRFAEPEEIAYAIAFLVSPAAAYINGINVPVDGGRTGCL